MKFFRNAMLIFMVTTFISTVSVAQQYSLRDQKEIQYRAQLTLNLYKDLLNVISISGLATDAEIKELIRNSYQEPNTQIFFSGQTIIEDDIKPSNRKSGIEQDKSVKDYLRYFDLIYEKYDQETVEFSDFSYSNLKYGDYLYIKVKFTSQFKGSHKEDPTPYQAVERLAELRVEKVNKEWRTLITSIIYYNPVNGITSAEGDVTLDKSVVDDGTYSYLIDRSKNGINSVEELQLAGQYARFANKQDSIFNHYLKVGEVALAAEKFDEAFDAYSEAQQIYPLNITLRQKVIELNRAQNRRSNREDEKYEEAIVNAERAQAARDYVKAKIHYAEALRIKPYEKSIQERIGKLEKIIQQLALLESKFNVGEYKEAIKDYNKIIKASKANADYYYGRGKCYEKLDDYKDAIKDYSTAISLDGNFVEALNSRAKLYILTNQPHYAIADYSLIITNPDYAVAFYPELAKVRKSVGDYKGAIEDLNAVIKLNPQEAEYYYERGLLYYLDKQPEEAVQSYGQALEKNNNFVNAFYQRGLTYVDLNNPQAASLDFAKGRELGLEKEQQSTIQNIAFNYFIVGERSIETENYETALESYTNAILISPAYGSAWLRKGDAHYNLQDYRNAIQNYHKAIELDSISLAYYRRGVAYQQIEEEQSAIQDFKRYVLIGKLLVAKLEDKIKQEKFSGLQSSVLAGENAEVLYTLGYAQFMTEQFADALKNLDKAIRIKKSYPEALFARGSTQYALKEYKKGIKDIEKGIKLGFAGPSAYYSLGLAYEAKGKLKDAIEHYSNAIQLDQQHEGAYKHRAMCYKEQKQYKQALDDVKAVLVINTASNKDVQLLANKGLLELYQSDIQEANQSFDQALSLKGDAPWALYGKACALAIQNKLEESLLLYQKAFQTNQIQWSAIKNDPLINPVKKQKAFKNLVQASF